MSYIDKERSRSLPNNAPRQPSAMRRRHHARVCASIPFSFIGGGAPRPAPALRASPNKDYSHGVFAYNPTAARSSSWSMSVFSLLCPDVACAVPSYPSKPLSPTF
jgi:hypothetical protein